MSVRKNPFVLKLFAMLLTLAALPATVRAQHHHDHDVDVEVVNTPNVKVVNTPSVNVNNLPAVQLAPGTAVTVSGTPTVQVGNAVQLAPGTAVTVSGTPTVQISNTAANPVPVRDESTPKRTPFQTSDAFIIQENIVGGSIDIAIPSGKRLVIEYVSAFADFLQAPPIYFIQTQDSLGGAFNHYLPVLQVLDRGQIPQFTGPAISSITGQVMKLHSENSVRFGAIRAAPTTGSGGAVVQVSISGYLEDVQ